MSEFKKEARTLFASKAMELSDMFAVKFGTTAFDGNPRRVVKLQPPAESTGGGAQARESIVLLPVGSDGAGSIMCGWADVAAKAAELRNFRAVSATYKARHNAPLQMDEAQYNAFVAQAQTFFQQEGFAVVVSADAPAPSAGASRSDVPAQKSGGSSMGLFLAFAVVAIGLGLGIGWFLFGRGG